MKYREAQRRMSLDTSLPSSVKNWLGHELEVRGIDAVIYSRYILSILQQDSIELEYSDTDIYLPCKKDLVKKRKNKRNEKKKLSDFSSDEMKRTAAVECLLSLTDEESGIENLVDELCSRLKDYQAKKALGGPILVQHDLSEGSDSVISTSPEDPAERYYAAFPALRDEVEGKLTAQQSDAGIWSKLPNKVLEAASARKPDDGMDSGNVDPEVAGGSDVNQACKKAVDPHHMVEDSLQTQAGGDDTLPLPKPGGSSKQEGTDGQRASAAGKGISPSLIRPPLFVMPKVITASKVLHGQSFDDLKKSSERSVHLTPKFRPSRKCEVSSNTEPAEDIKPLQLEDHSWYTDSLDNLFCVSPHPVSREPLYKRNSFGNDLLQPSPIPLASNESGEADQSRTASRLLPIFLNNGSLKMRMMMRDTTKTLQQLDQEFAEEMDLISPTLRADSEFLMNLQEEQSEDLTEPTKPVTVWVDDHPEISPAYKGEPGLLQVVDEGSTKSSHDFSFGSTHNDSNTSEHDFHLGSVHDSSTNSEQDFHFGTGLEFTPTNEANSRFLKFFTTKSNEQVDSSEPVYKSAHVESPLEKTGRNVIEDVENQLADCHDGESKVTHEVTEDIDPFKDALFWPERKVSCASEFSLEHNSGDEEVFKDSVPWPENQVGEDTLSSKESSLLCSPILETICSPEHGSRLMKLFHLDSSPACDPKTLLEAEGVIGGEEEEPKQEQSKFLKLFHERPDSEQKEDIFSWEKLHDTSIEEETDEGAIQQILDSSNENCDILYQEEINTAAEEVLPECSLKCSSEDSENTAIRLSTSVAALWSPSTTTAGQYAWSVTTHSDHGGLTHMQNEFHHHQGSIISKPSYFSGMDSTWGFRESGLMRTLGGLYPLPDFLLREQHHDDLPQCELLFSIHLSPRREAGMKTFHLWDVNAHDKPAVEKELDIGADQSGTSLEDLLSLDISFNLNHPRRSSFFIEGGLYGITPGNIWKSLPSGYSGTDWWSHALACCMSDGNDFDEVPGERTINQLPWDRKGNLSYIRQRSISLDEGVSVPSPHMCLLANFGQISSRFELMPSECSAFQDAIPQKLTHSLSEPNLPKKMELKITTPPNRRESSDKEDLLFSPETHFKPIHTPSLTKADTVKVDGTDKGNTCSCAGSEECCMDNFCESYQLYQGLETTSKTNFIPKFKIQTDRDKFAQTGESEEKKVGADEVMSSEDETPMEEDLDSSHDVELEEESVDSVISNRVAGVLSLGLDDDDIDVSHEVVEEELNSQVYIDGSVTSPKAELVSADTEAGMETPHKALIEGEKLVSLWGLPGEEVKSGEKEDSSVKYKSIWSTGTESDIPGLLTVEGSRLLKTESVAHPDEDRLLKTEIVAHPGEDGLLKTESVAQPSEVEEVKWSTGEPEVEAVQESTDEADECDDVFTDNAAEFESHMFPMDENLTAHGHVLYSSDLEQEWMKAAKDFEVQVPNRKLKPKGGYRKPCTFFMEGQCHRNDCKYSHNLSRITCRFWEEGECFKGITCPFLHGYPRSENSEDSAGTDSDFHLEKEDFPALGSQEKTPSKSIELLLSQQSKSTKRPKVETAGSNKRRSAAKDKYKSISFPIEIKAKKR